jgi:hypothetical protein
MYNLMLNGIIIISSPMSIANVCLICVASVAVSNRPDIKRHFMIMHKGYISKFPDKKYVETKLRIET